MELLNEWYGNIPDLQIIIKLQIEITQKKLVKINNDPEDD